MKKLFHISNVYVVGIFQSLLEEDNFSCKLGFHKGFELLSGKPYFYACFVPLLFTFVKLLNQRNGLLQSRLCIFLVTPPNQHNFFVICGMLACWHVGMFLPLHGQNKNLQKVVQVAKGCT
jgi:hypothetical protein